MPQMARSFQWYFDGLLCGPGSEGSSWTRLWREGSEGSEGSACLWQAGSKGCGLPLRAMLIKSALRDWLYGSYSKITILVISRCAAPPYPAAPDFLHGKACHTILRSLRFLTNRVPLPPHPGDRINHSMLSCRDIAPWLSTHSAPACGGGKGTGFIGEPCDPRIQ